MEVPEWDTRLLRPMPADSPHPAYRVRTQRLELRCYEPADAAPLQELLAANRAHLLPYMTWAKDEPQSVDEKLEFIRQRRGRFDLGQDFTYGVFEGETRELIGGCGLHPRCGEGGLEIGYYIDHRHIRRGYATEVAAALTRVGIEVLGVSRIELRCHPDNAASIKISEKLGFAREGILYGRLAWHDEQRADVVSFCLTAARYLESPAAAWSIEAYDALRRRIV